MCIRVWLEVGHTCEPCCPGRTLAQDWRLWVRGADGRDISHFVQKVVFYLKPESAFVYPKRVLQEPPYEIEESGSVSLSVPIHVYLKEDNRPKEMHLKYELTIDNATKTGINSRIVFFDIQNPSDQLMKTLIRGGGTIIGRADDPNCGKDYFPMSMNVEIVGPIYKPEDPMTRPSEKRGINRNRIIKLTPCKHTHKTKPYPVDKDCFKCLNLHSTLKSVAMTTDEINHALRQHIAINMYECSGHAIELPPLSDPIFTLPELPKSLEAEIQRVNMNFIGL